MPMLTFTGIHIRDSYQGESFRLKPVRAAGPPLTLIEAQRLYQRVRGSCYSYMHHKHGWASGRSHQRLLCEYYAFVRIKKDDELRIGCVIPGKIAHAMHGSQGWTPAHAHALRSTPRYVTKICDRCNREAGLQIVTSGNELEAHHWRSPVGRHSSGKKPPDHESEDSAWPIEFSHRLLQVL